MKESNAHVNGHAQCNTRSILLLFSALCLTMTGCLILYMYHMDQVVDLSVRITNNVKQFIKYDMPAFRNSFGLDSSMNGTLNNIASSSTVKSVVTSQHIKVTTKLVAATRKTITTGTKAQTITTTKTKPTTARLKVLTTPQAGRKDECVNCFNHNFNYVIDNPDICKQQDSSVPIEIIVFIFTTHARRQQRDTIRKTWISIAQKNQAPNIRYAFLLGGTKDESLSKAVIEENSSNHDIIKEDFVDTYQNLTYKTMMAYKWASTKCAHAQFVMKTDDDMYVNIPAVFHIIRTHKDALQTSVGGACHQTAWPIRDKGSKWFASKKSYPNAKYPGFCSGTGYVTSMNVATKVFEISPQVPFFHLEDVYVALCIKKLKYSLKGIGGFNSGRVKPDPCIYKSNKMVTSHELPPALIEQIWNGECKQATAAPSVTKKP